MKLHHWNQHKSCARQSFRSALPQPEYFCQEVFLIALVRLYILQILAYVLNFNSSCYVPRFKKNAIELARALAKTTDALNTNFIILRRSLFPILKRQLQGRSTCLENVLLAGCPNSIGHRNCG